MLFLQQAQNHLQSIHPLWDNAFFYLFIATVIILGISLIIFNKIFKKKSFDLKLTQQQHIARIDNIRKENIKTLENIRVEMLRKEEERSHQWMESEKEALHVLNGVSNLLDLTDRVQKIEFNNFNEGLKAIRREIINEKKLIKKLKISDERYQLLFNNSIIGIAYHEVIYDKNGKPCDFRYVAVNQAFEDLTGFNKEDVIGKTMLELLPELEISWIANFGSVAMTGTPMIFENYSKELNKTYKVTAYSTEPNKLISIFMVIGETQ